MEKVTNGIVVFRNILSIICTIVVIGVLGWYGYTYFVGSKTISDSHRFFEMKVPGKFNFIDNPNNSSSENPDGLSVYDSTKGVYIYGNAYEISENDEDLNSYTSIDRDNYVESLSGMDVSEVSKLQIEGYDNAYTYSFIYTDSNGDDYFMQVYWIRTEIGLYSIDMECPIKNKDIYSVDFDKMINSFSEFK